MLQPQALATLKQEYDNAYEAISEKSKTLETFKDDYKALRNRLRTLPDKIEHEALVPLGPKAMGFGKIIHTNEIMCMLGDNWFMECSAKTAVEIVDRRIKKCDQHLEEQKQEAERLENWKKSLTALILESAQNDTLEINEEVTEEDYERIAREHRESVKRFHQEKAQERLRKSPEETRKENEEFWARLDEFELEEEMLQAQDEYEKRKKSAGSGASSAHVPVISTSSTPSTSKSEPTPSTSKSKPTPSTSKSEPTPSTSKSKPTPSTSKATPLPSTKSTTKSALPKPTKSVTFSGKDEVRIIPEVTKEDYHDFYDREDSPEDFAEVAPMLPVQGVKETVIERLPNPAPSLVKEEPAPAPMPAIKPEPPTKLESAPKAEPPSKPEPAPKPSTPRPDFDPKAEAVPIKKSSLFKQRRQN